MIGKILTGILAMFMVGLSAGPLAASDTDATLRRQDDGEEVVVASDDDDGDSTSNDSRSGSNWRTGNSARSADATNSRESRVSRDRDRSRGDRTRDLTFDGPGGIKRDWSAGHTNDRSRNDTR